MNFIQFRIIVLTYGTYIMYSMVNDWYTGIIDICCRVETPDQPRPKTNVRQFRLKRVWEINLKKERKIL